MTLKSKQKKVADNEKHKQWMSAEWILTLPLPTSCPKLCNKSLSALKKKFMSAPGL
jgi:hypothetical protein